MGQLEDIVSHLQALTDGQARLEREIRQLRAELAQKPVRWISRREAAEARGVSLDTIDRLISNGELRSTKVGRAVRVLDEQPVSDVEVARLSARAVAR